MVGFRLRHYFRNKAHVINRVKQGTQAHVTLSEGEIIQRLMAGLNSEFLRSTLPSSKPQSITNLVNQLTSDHVAPGNRVTCGTTCGTRGIIVGTARGHAVHISFLLGLVSQFNRVYIV